MVPNQEDSIQKITLLRIPQRTFWALAFQQGSIETFQSTDLVKFQIFGSWVHDMINIKLMNKTLNSDEMSLTLKTLTDLNLTFLAKELSFHHTCQLELQQASISQIARL